MHTDLDSMSEGEGRKHDSDQPIHFFHILCQHTRVVLSTDLELQLRSN